MIQLNDIQSVYFAGIGGIGMSAIARFFLFKHVAVYGYDRTDSKLTKQLEAEGASIEYSFEKLPDLSQVDCVIYTPALREEHPLIQYCRASNIPMLKRAEVLGLVSRSYTTLAVAGTHGKTSTTSLLTHILRVGGIDVTAFLGGISVDLNSNFVAGASEYVVVEADEYDRSFLHLSPTHAAIMNTDADHLDIYGTHDEMLKTFHQFIELIPSTGSLTTTEVVDQGILQKADYAIGVNADFSIENVRPKNGTTCYQLNTPNGSLDIQTTFHGYHNAVNAAAAISIAQQVGVSNSDIQEALKTFKGIARRFELKYQSNDCVIIDDYAHHPTEIQAACQAARTLYPNKKIGVIFQPHLFSRTQDFLVEFAHELNKFDTAILVDVYPAREEPIAGVTSQRIVDLMTNDVLGAFSLDQVVDQFNSNQADVWLILGAGDLSTRIPELIAHISQSE